MVKNKILKNFLVTVILLSMLLISFINFMSSNRVSAEDNKFYPEIGKQQPVEILWSRTSEPYGAKSLTVASWNFKDVADINYDKTDDVWDGGTIGNYYVGSYIRKGEIATWHTDRDGWRDGACDVRRFRGEFRIPDGYTVFDEVKLVSEVDYSSLGLNDIIAINDNIYVFVYPKYQEINDSNFMDYFAFWTGTACQDLATQANGGNPITFHEKPGTTPWDYKKITGGSIPQSNLLAHTDGWYCEATPDNIGYILKNNPNDSEFIIDIFVEDFAEDGGMDRMNIIFTKTTEFIEETEDTSEETEPETTEKPEETTEFIEEIQETSEDIENIEDTDVPQTTTSGNYIPYIPPADTTPYNPTFTEADTVIPIKNTTDNTIYNDLTDNSTPLNSAILPDETYGQTIIDENIYENTDEVDEFDIPENSVPLENQDIGNEIAPTEPELSISDISEISNNIDNIDTENGIFEEDDKKYNNPKTADNRYIFMILAGLTFAVICINIMNINRRSKFIQK